MAIVHHAGLEFRAAPRAWSPDKVRYCTILDRVIQALMQGWWEVRSCEHGVTPFSHRLREVFAARPLQSRSLQSISDPLPRCGANAICIVSSLELVNRSSSRATRAFVRLMANSRSRLHPVEQKFRGRPLPVAVMDAPHDLQMRVAVCFFRTRFDGARLAVLLTAVTFSTASFLHLYPTRELCIRKHAPPSSVP